MNTDKASGPAWLVAGCSLDRYDLLLPIAEGGMAKLWLARQHGKHGFDKMVAIKTILPRLAQEPGFQQMFLDEARLASRVEHVNVAQVLDLGEENGVIFLVMEWLDGESLINVGRLVARKANTLAIPVAILARIAADGCAGLQAAHELIDIDGMPLNVVHRDVSPHNLLVGFHGTTKVIDFGIAKARNRVTSKTSDGVVKGKVAYMAPEQAMGIEVDCRTDVWGIGATMYRFLADRTPFSAANQMATLRLLLSGEPPPRLPNTAPEAFRRVVHRALELDPVDRFQSAEEMRSALEDAMRSANMVATHADVAAFMNQHFGLARADRMRAIDYALRESRSRSIQAATPYVSRTNQKAAASVPSSGKVRSVVENEDPEPNTLLLDSGDIVSTGPPKEGEPVRTPVPPPVEAFDPFSVPEILAPRVTPSTVPPEGNQRHPLEFRLSEHPRGVFLEGSPSDGDFAVMAADRAHSRSGAIATRVRRMTARVASRAVRWSSALVVVGACLGLAAWTRSRTHSRPPSIPVGLGVALAAPAALPSASVAAPAAPVAPSAASVVQAASPVQAGSAAAAPARLSPPSAEFPAASAPPSTLVDRARRAESAGKSAEAWTLLTEAVSREPTNSEALTRLAEVEKTRGMTSAAIADYRRAVATNGRYFPSRLGLADMTWDNGQQADAKALYKSIVDDFPSSLCPDRARDRARDGD